MNWLFWKEYYNVKFFFFIKPKCCGVMHEIKDFKRYYIICWNWYQSILLHSFYWEYTFAFLFFNRSHETNTYWDSCGLVTLTSRKLATCWCTLWRGVNCTESTVCWAHINLSKWWRSTIQEAGTSTTEVCYYNNRVRTARGFTLDELKAAGISKKSARTYGGFFVSGFLSLKGSLLAIYIFYIMYWNSMYFLPNKCFEIEKVEILLLM